MKEQYRLALWLWREHVFRYRRIWVLTLVLHLLFFAISGILPFFFRRVIDALTLLDIKLFASWIAIFIGTEIAQVFLLYARGYATRLLELKVEQDLQVGIYHQFHTIPYEQAMKMRTGEVLQRIMSDVPRCSPLIIKSFSELLGHIVLVLIVLSLMFVMAPLLAGISVAFVAVYIVGLRVYKRRAQVIATRRQKAEAQYIAEAEEGLEALYSVRVQAGFRTVMRRFSHALGAYLRESFALYKLNLLFQGGFTTLVTVASEVAILLIGAWLIFQREATVGTLVAFSQYINWLYVFVNFMSGFMAEIEPAFVSLRRVQEVFGWPKEWVIEEPVVPTELPSHLYAIEVQDLDFTLGDIPVFRKLSLKIKRGVTTAVVGRSGLGKSTLLNIMLGLYPVPPGKVFLFGRDITTIPLSERMGIFAVVEQEPKFLSGGDIADLLFLESQKRADIIDMARKLGLEEFVDNMFSRSIASAKLSELSGGERKRLGILRGLLRDAPVLLLDEPTAFLDMKTSERILAGIATAFSDKTIVMFSHDPLVLRYCQEVIDLAAAQISSKAL